MAGILFNLPKARAFTAGGTIGAGYKLYFYAAGTSTPLTVYQDAALTATHPQPVVADAAGVFPPIYVPAGAAYKVELLSASGVLQTGYPVDSVPADDAASLRADLASTTNSAKGNKLVYYPRTAAEVAAAIVPTDYTFPDTDPRRYGSAAMWKFVVSGTQSYLELKAVDPSDPKANVFIRFRDTDNNTKGLMGFTASGDDTMSMTSYMNHRLKFRTGNAAETSFIDRLFVFGTDTQSWIGVQAPAGTAQGGCFIRFTTDDFSVTKGLIGYGSASDDDIDVLNSTTTGGINIEVAGSGAVTTTTTTGNINQSAGGAARLIVKPNGAVNFVPRASAPTSPVAGDAYYDSGTNKLRVYDGSTWNNCW